MTSQPPLVPGFAVPTSSPFCAFQSASPTTCQPASVEPLTMPSGLKFAGPAALMPECHHGDGNSCYPE